MRNRTFQIVAIAGAFSSLCMLAGGAFAARYYFFPSTNTILTSDSPDGRYRVIIRESHAPRVSLDSRQFSYTLALYNLPDETLVPGDPYTEVDGRCTCMDGIPNFSAAWTKTGLTINRHDTPFREAKISNGKQIWK